MLFHNELSLPQHQFDSTCLTFFLLDGGEPNRDPDADYRRLGQVYCLETGTVHWPDMPNMAPVSLRGNDRLAEWEPMNADKFVLIATDANVTGPTANLPGRVDWPAVSTLVVSPQGFLMNWDNEFDKIHIRTSDVGRLTNVHQPLANRDDGWDEYSIDTRNGQQVVIGPGLEGVPSKRAWAGNERMPIPGSPYCFDVDTLAACNHTVLTPIEKSENRHVGDYAPEAAQFVRRHLGVDPATVDWQTAASARLVNAQYANTAPFTPIPARTALRGALARSVARNPTVTTGIGRHKPARTHTQRELPRRITP